jgi:RhtB (resistance to homoserine/threonine) family protein
VSGYAGEFLRITVAHALAAASPGPDFAIVLRQSLTHGRKAGMLTALGIATGLTVHLTYALFGVQILIRHAPAAFQVIKWVGAAYLAWIGINSFRASFAPPFDAGGARGPHALIDVESGTAGVNAPGYSSRHDVAHFYRSGLLTNLLNPKVALFFAAIFATLVSPTTPTPVRLGYGAWICLLTVAWFALVAIVFTHAPVRRRFRRLGPWIDRTLGVVFVGFAALLAVSNLR